MAVVWKVTQLCGICPWRLASNGRDPPALQGNGVFSLFPSVSPQWPHSDRRGGQNLPSSTMRRVQKLTAYRNAIGSIIDHGF